MDEHAPPDVFRRSGSRLREALDPDLKREFYPGRWDHMRHEMPAIHAFDKAHCLMLGEEGIVARDIVRELLRGLREMEVEGMLEARRSDVTRQDARLWALERRVRVEVDRSLPEQGSPSIVEVRLRDVRMLSETVDSPRGSLARPATQNDLVGKFRDLARRVLPRNQVSELETLVMGPGLLTGIPSLWTLLQPR
jgi:hypothetical protein